MQPQNPLRAALVHAALRLLAPSAGPLTEVRVTVEGGGATLTLVVTPDEVAALSGEALSDEPQAEEEEGGRPVSRCVIDILATLEEVGRPLTTTRPMSEMAKRGREWSQRRVAHYLAMMVKDGTLVSGEGKTPPGYRLPEWTQDKQAKRDDDGEEGKKPK